MAVNSVRIIFFTFISFIVMTMQSNGIRAEELAPHLYKTIFENGQTIVVKETPGSNVVTVQIWVKAGSVYEDPAEAGITHFIEHMIFKGTPTRGPGALAEAIEGVGGRITPIFTAQKVIGSLKKAPARIIRMINPSHQCLILTIFSIMPIVLLVEETLFSRDNSGRTSRNLNIFQD